MESDAASTQRIRVMRHHPKVVSSVIILCLLDFVRGVKVLTLGQILVNYFLKLMFFSVTCFCNIISFKL